MQLKRESGTAEEQSLDKEARKWASRVAREYKSVVHIQKVRTADGSLHQSSEHCQQTGNPSSYTESCFLAWVTSSCLWSMIHPTAWFPRVSPDYTYKYVNKRSNVKTIFQVFYSNLSISGISSSYFVLGSFSNFSKFTSKKRKCFTELEDHNCLFGLNVALFLILCALFSDSGGIQDAGDIWAQQCWAGAQDGGGPTQSA